MAAPEATDADVTEASSLATNIASLEQTRVVDENASDLAPYGLAEPKIKIAFKAEGGKSGEVHLGDKTPTAGDVYAVMPGTKKVFLVSSFLETTFDKKPFDLRDKRVVKFERDKVDALELTRGNDSIRMTRKDSEWKVDKPIAGRGDYSHDRRAAHAAVHRRHVRDRRQQRRPTSRSTGSIGRASRSRSGAGSSQAVLEIGNARRQAVRARQVAADGVHARHDAGRRPQEAVRPVPQEGPVRVAALLDGQGAGHARTDGGAKTWEFSKIKRDNADVWQVAPEGGQAVDADRPKLDDLLNKLTDLKMGALVDGTKPTGLNAPILTVSVSYDNGKFERVKVGRAGGQAYGNREGEQATGEVAADSLKAALDAIDGAVAPPAKPAETPPRRRPRSSSRRRHAGASGRRGCSRRRPRWPWLPAGRASSTSALPGAHRQPSRPRVRPAPAWRSTREFISSAARERAPRRAGALPRSPAIPSSRSTSGA